METYKSILEIATADFLKRGWSVNLLHRLPHKSELSFNVAVNKTPRLSIEMTPIVAGSVGRVNITLRLYLENNDVVVETSVPTKKRFILPDIKQPVNTYRLDTQGLSADLVLKGWKSISELETSGVLISPTLGIADTFSICNSAWLCLGSGVDGDWVSIPTNGHTEPPGLGPRAAQCEIMAICKLYLEQTTDFGKVVWLQYLIAKFCNFYCNESNELTRKTLLHVLATKTGLPPDIRAEDPNWYVLDLDHGLRYRFCDTHPHRAHSMGQLPDEELDKKFPNGTLQVSVYGTIVNERPLYQFLDEDFHNLLEYALLAGDRDALPWVEFCKLHYGECGFMALVESRPEYRLIRRLNKEKK